MQAPLQTSRLFPKLNTKKYIYYTHLRPFQAFQCAYSPTRSQNPTQWRLSQFTVVFTPHFTPHTLLCYLVTY